MKKIMLAAAACAAMSMALCACNKADPADPAKPTGTLTDIITPIASEATKAPSAVEEALAKLPVTNYDDYVASTVLPTGYIGIEVEKITDADVDVYVQEVLENNKERELKDGPIEEGDIAIIDYTGYLDGVAFEGGSDIGHEMEIGNSGFIDGFDTGLIGAKKGDTVTLNLTFPVNYHNVELAGKDVVFEVKINSTAAQVLPEFTDEFVTKLTSGEYTTTEDFRAYAKGFLSEERRYTKVMDYLVENTTFGKMNEEYISAAFDFEKQYYASSYGFNSVEEFEELFGEENSQVLWTMVEREIRRFEQERIVLYCVAKAEELTLSEDEFKTNVTEYAQQNNMTVEELYKVQNEAALRQSMLMEVALEHLLENVTEVEKGEEE